MKSKYLFFSLSFLITLFTACRKDGKMTATIDGKLWSSETALGMLHADGPYTLILIASSEQPQTSFNFLIDYKALKENTYHTDDIKKNFLISYGSHEVYDSFAETRQNYKFWQYHFDKGILKITKLDTIHKRISGTFNFMMVNPDNEKKSIKVTNGSFDNIFYDY